MNPKEGANEFTAFGGPDAFGPSPLEKRLKETNVPESVSRAIIGMVFAPPKIERLPKEFSDFIPVITNAGEEETPVQVDRTLTIPINGEPLKQLLEKTGLADLNAILERLTGLATEEGLNIIIAYNDSEDAADGAEAEEMSTGNPGNVIVNFHYNAGNRIREENENFMDMFEWEVF